MTAGIEQAANIVDSATVMGLLPDKPRLLGLGEPAHGEEVLLNLRNELFRQLVEQEDVRARERLPDGPGCGRLPQLG